MYSSTTLHYSCATPHYIQQLWWGDHCNHCNHCNHFKKHNSNHLSVHQRIRSAIRDSQQPTLPIGFIFLKLPPPPCAALLEDLLVNVLPWMNEPWWVHACVNSAILILPLRNASSQWNQRFLVVLWVLAIVKTMQRDTAIHKVCRWFGPVLYTSCCLVVA